MIDLNNYLSKLILLTEDELEEEVLKMIEELLIVSKKNPLQKQKTDTIIQELNKIIKEEEEDDI